MDGVKIFIILNDKTNEVVNRLKLLDDGKTETPYVYENLIDVKNKYSFQPQNVTFSSLYVDKEGNSFLFCETEFQGIDCSDDNKKAKEGKKPKVQKDIDGILSALIKKTKEVNPKIKTLFLSLKKNHDKDILDELMKNNNTRVWNFGKTFILNKCFMDSGFTLYGNNIPHEAINKFEADADDKGKKNRYFFLCDNGKLSDFMENPHQLTYKYFDMDQAQLISFSKYEKRKNNTYAFIQRVTEIEISHSQDEYKDIKYDTVPIADIFKVNGFGKGTGFNAKKPQPSSNEQPPIVYTTFKLKEGGKVERPEKIGENTFTYAEDGLAGKLVKEMRQYVFEGTNLYDAIESKLNKETWIDDKPNDFTASYQEEPSVLGLIGREERENYLSDLLAFILLNSPSILSEFLNLRDIGAYKVYREEKNVDLLIRGENAIVVIENKINADFNEGEKKSWESFIKEAKDEEQIKDINKADSQAEGEPSQLSKYYNLAQYYAEKEKKETGKEITTHYFILCPKYKKEYYTKEKEEYKRGGEYTPKTYGELYTAMENAGLKDFSPAGQEIARDFMRTIKQFTFDQNTFYMDRACGRFVNRIQELKKTPPKKGGKGKN